MERGRLKQSNQLAAAVLCFFRIAACDDVSAGARFRRIRVPAGQRLAQRAAAKDFPLRSTGSAKTRDRECRHNSVRWDRSGRRVPSFDLAQNAEYDDYSMDLTGRHFSVGLGIGRGSIAGISFDHHFYDHFRLCGTKQSGQAIQSVPSAVESFY